MAQGKITAKQKEILEYIKAVSYTHLDVYKRQQGYKCYQSSFFIA